MLSTKRVFLTGLKCRTQTCWFSVGFLQKKNKKQKKGNAVPPQFLSQLKQWPNLLQEEINAAGEQVALMLDKSAGSEELRERGMIISGLKYSGRTFCPVKGHLTKFDFRFSKSDVDMNKFRKGSPIMVCTDKNSERLGEGIIMEKTNTFVMVKLGRKLGSAFEADKSYCIVPSNHAGSTHSLRDFLKEDFLQNCTNINLLLYAYRGLSMPSVHNDRVSSEISTNLNDSQRRAVAAALNKKRPFVCIRGPPGTGKTQVLAEIVRLLVQKKQKVLVCAPTHVAVQNAISKTVNSLNPESDLGNAADYIDDIANAVPTHKDFPQLEKLIKEIEDLRETDSTNKSIESMTKRVGALKRRIISKLHKERQVIFSTLTSSSVQMLSSYKWVPDVIIIDEAGQCMEPTTWACIVKSQRCILVGDEMQLPPVVLSQKSQKANLNVSLLERLAKEFSSNNIVHQLNIQYRMNEKIMRWSSDNFYNSLLTAAPNIANINISCISDIPPEHPACRPLIMMNTDTFKSSEFNEVKKFDSYYNIGEAKLIKSYVQFLLNMQVASDNIGVITPYFSQTLQIKKLLKNCGNVTVSSVDAFQGNEKDIILFSLVRRNGEGELGFLRDYRRLNVAVTRARRQFVLFGSSEMLQADRTLRTLFQTFKKHGHLEGADFMQKYILS